LGPGQGGPDLTPDRWLALSVRSRSGQQPGLLADGLISLGGRAAQESGGTFTTYLPAPADPVHFAEEALRALEAHTGLTDLHVSWSWQVQEDWAELWKRGLGVRRVTDRIVVRPSWLEFDGRPGDVVLRLDPGMAFGTAEHGTTRGCLRLLDGLVTGGEQVFDVGTGSGILAIAAARLGASHVRAVEMDPLACEAAEENADANGVSDRVLVEEGAVTESWLAGLPLQDGVMANLETHLLLPLLAGLARGTRPGGWLLLSGILIHERDRVVAAVGDVQAGMDLEAEDVDGEWWSAAFRRSVGGGTG